MDSSSESFTMRHLTTASFLKNRWIWYWIAFLFIRCCTSCLFGNFFVQASQVTKLVIKTTKSFSPKLGVLQASNLNFIDSLFSCRDNGGFLAELNSDLRIEAFTSLIMVSMIHICLCLVNNGGFGINTSGWKLVKWRQPLVVGTLWLWRGGTFYHETIIVRVQEWSSARTRKEMILMMFVNKGKWRWLHSGEDATALFGLIEWAPGRWVKSLLAALAGHLDNVLAMKFTGNT